MDLQTAIKILKEEIKANEKMINDNDGSDFAEFVRMSNEALIRVLQEVA